jgi:four helix bundle protein
MRCAIDTTGGSFRTFEDLEAYKAARAFRVAMYAVSRRLPSFEKYELASQIRRAAVSLTNNIAEGHGRWHFLDHIKFVLQARGSLQELLDDVNVCEDEQYLPTAEIAKLKEQGWHVLKLINGYLRYLRDRKVGNSLGFMRILLLTATPTTNWRTGRPACPFSPLNCVTPLSRLAYLTHLTLLTHLTPLPCSYYN